MTVVTVVVRGTDCRRVVAAHAARAAAKARDTRKAESKGNQR